MSDVLNYQNPEHYLGHSATANIACDVIDQANHSGALSDTRLLEMLFKRADKLKKTPDPLKIIPEHARTNLEIGTTYLRYREVIRTIIRQISTDDLVRETSHWLGESCRILNEARKMSISSKNYTFIEWFGEPIDIESNQSVLWKPRDAVHIKNPPVVGQYKGSNIKISVRVHNNIMNNFAEILDQMADERTMKKHNLPIMTKDGEIFTEDNLQFYSSYKRLKENIFTPDSHSPNFLPLPELVSL